jgi:arabinan endo-1,5-alpha-L-arabinosidase
MQTCSLAIALLFFATAEDAKSAMKLAHPPCADPAIIARDDGAGYVVFCTGRGIPFCHSGDLHQWNHAGRVFESAVPDWALKAVPGATAIWAPDISHFSGKYHLYYSVSTFGSQHSVIGLAVNETLDPSSPKYAWKDRGLVIESRPGQSDFNAIDPALFVDRDGAPYLFWGSFWTGIKATRIDPATGKPVKQPPEIVPIAARAGGSDPSIEAAYVVFREGFYYLFVSWGSCCDGAQSTYRIVVGRAKSVLGPYVDRQGKSMLEGHGTLILASDDRWRGTGHNSMLKTDRGEWLVHACYDARNPRTRVLNVRPIQWKDGWPVIGTPLSSDNPTPPTKE